MKTDLGSQEPQFHTGDGRVGRLFQYKVLMKWWRLKQGVAIDTQRKGAHLGLEMRDPGLQKWPGGTCCITSWGTSEDLQWPDPQLEAQPPTQAKARWAQLTSRWEQAQLGSTGSLKSDAETKNKGLLLYWTKYIYTYKHTQTYVYIHKF